MGVNVPFMPMFIVNMRMMEVITGIIEVILPDIEGILGNKEVI